MQLQTLNTPVTAAQLPDDTTASTEITGEGN
jgi:hypothetical protein